MKDLGKAKHTPFFIVHGDNDRVLPVKNTRSLIEKMKELEIDHQYREVEKGDHVTVAWRYFDEIFDFFDKHKK
jgi:predicted esterase